MHRRQGMEEEGRTGDHDPGAVRTERSDACRGGGMQQPEGFRGLFVFGGFFLLSETDTDVMQTASSPDQTKPPQKRHKFSPAFRTLRPEGRGWWGVVGGFAFTLRT